MPLFSPSGSLKWIRISISEFPKQPGWVDSIQKNIGNPPPTRSTYPRTLTVFDVVETNDREKESEDDKGFTVTYHPEYLMEEDGEEESLQNAMSDLSVARRMRSKTSSRTASPSKQGRSRSSSPNKMGSRSPIKKSGSPLASPSKRMVRSSSSEKK
jgi:hypothetical protein